GQKTLCVLAWDDAARQLGANEVSDRISVRFAREGKVAVPQLVEGLARRAIDRVSEDLLDVMAKLAVFVLEGVPITALGDVVDVHIHRRRQLRMAEPPLHLLQSFAMCE